MNSETDTARSLRDMELEVEAEGREWMRRRLEEKLQAEANRHGGVFPPERAQSTSPATDAPASAHGLRGGGIGRVAGKRPR